MSLVGLAVSPSGLSDRCPSTPGSKRKIIPSAELSPSKRVLVLTTPTKRPDHVSPGESFSIRPFFAPRQLFPSGEAKIAQQYTHAHPPPRSKQQSADEDAIWHTRQVLLPFDLRDPKVNIEKDEIQDLLLKIFPGTHNVTETGSRSHLIFQVEQLPSSPWPLSIGGLPFTITTETEGRALIFPARVHGNPKVSICGDGGKPLPQYSDANLRRLAADVTTYFEKNVPGIRILELMHTCERTIYIVLENHISISAVRLYLPGKIANCFVGYVLDREFQRPAWVNLPAKRVVQPNPIRGVVDNTAYDVLRPGVLIRSRTFLDNAHPAILSTTSGVFVKNPAGDIFMTGASHGIGENEKVWQADCPERTIARAVVEISFTDISLLKLEDGVDFVNETFETDAGTVPEFIRLRTSEDELPPHTTCYINSPYTGNMEGIVVAKSVRIHGSSHPAERNLRYVVYDWAYLGQEEGNEGRFKPPDGTCGSAIWNEDGIIMGFYRFYLEHGSWAGFSASVSASVVVDMGYQLAK